MIERVRIPLQVLLFISAFLCAIAGSRVFAQDSAQAITEDSAWNGRWVAEGTLFQIRVIVIDDVVVIEQIESMGQVWTHEQGFVIDGRLTVEVAYAGATGIIQAELIDEQHARVYAATCVPDFMVVCVLAKDREAIFRKIGD